MSKGTLPKTEEAPRFLTPAELADLLRLSLSSVYRLVEGRQIPFHRLSGSIRFAREDVEAFIAEGRIEPLANR